MERNTHRRNIKTSSSESRQPPLFGVISNKARSTSTTARSNFTCMTPQRVASVLNSSVREVVRRYLAFSTSVGSSAISDSSEIAVVTVPDCRRHALAVGPLKAPVWSTCSRKQPGVALVTCSRFSLTDRDAPPGLGLAMNLATVCALGKLP